MSLFKKIRLNRAKRQLNKALKIISKLSWEELDSIIPRTNYTNVFNNADWSKVNWTMPIL